MWQKLIYFYWKHTSLCTHCHRALAWGNSHESNPEGQLQCCSVSEGVGYKILQQYSDISGVDLSPNRTGGCVWQIYNFSCVMSMRSQPRLCGLLSAVLCAETSLHAAYRLAPAFWKPLCMNGLSAHLEMSLIDTKIQEKLHPRCFCYDLVVFSVNTWHL